MWLTEMLYVFFIIAGAVVSLYMFCMTSFVIFNLFLSYYWDHVKIELVIYGHCCIHGYMHRTPKKKLCIQFWHLLDINIHLIKNAHAPDV